MMGSKTRVFSAGELHPREAIFLTGNLGAVNAEVVIYADGCASVAMDLRGTFNMTVEVSGTVDGTNWIPIPVKPVNAASKLYVAAVTGAVPGLWVGACAGYRMVRARATVWTSGLAVCFLSASTVPLDPNLDGLITSNALTSTGAASAGVTLSMPTPGVGLRHYLTYLSVNRFAAAALTAFATPVLVTTTNLPGALAFTFPADALAQGQMDRWREDFAYAISSNAQNVATTIVCPATTGVIWRVTAGWYVAP
jgi:hypothetical protein